MQRSAITMPIPRKADSAKRHRGSLFTLILGVLPMVLGVAPARADGGVTFSDLAAEQGLEYSRTPSESIAVLEDLATLELFTPDLWPVAPGKPHGAPGAAILDYDGDGDLDIYVTNGPGRANSLFHNALAETGAVAFADVAMAAGIGAVEHDSSGTCFGDLDNDGDPDLLVVSNFGPNLLFENLGDGTFTDISATAGLGGEDRSSTSCSFGDVDNDGLLDVVVANTWADMSNGFGLVTPFDFTQHNQLFRNQGGNVFADVSAESGIEGTLSLPEGFEGLPTLTWAIALVDIDQDGDVDLIQADDQAGVPPAAFGGADRFIHFFENDGSGRFTDRSLGAGLGKTGSWMGLGFGDLDGDGDLDLYGSNLGDYAPTPITSLDPTYAILSLYELGGQASRWFLNQGPGAEGFTTFSDPGVNPPLVATPFGWGASVFDYDNDADLDVIMHGGLYFAPVGQGAPEALLQNRGDAFFDRDLEAFAGSTDHQSRTVQGVAVGDLDGNGFDDVVSVSSFDIPEEDQILYNHNWGSPFDGGRYAQLFAPTGDLSGNSVWANLDIREGSLAVELSSGDNGNRWAKVRTYGSAGVVSGASVNRDGIGAVVSFRTARGERVARPVLGGSSYASQDALVLTFGMGASRRAIVDVVWPGGTHNRFYGVRPRETVLLPEIPCDFLAEWDGIFDYAVCVFTALGELEGAGVVNERQTARLFSSALRAFLDERFFK